MLVDGPVVHLKRGIAPVSCESHHMVLAVVHRHAALLHHDVHQPDVEGDADFALFLKAGEDTKINTKK